MDAYTRFRKMVAAAAKEFKELSHKHPVRVISNYDADGISAGAILIHALQREKIPFSISIIQQLTQSLMEEYANEDYAVYLFADLGSKYLKFMHEHMKNKKIFVFDHHELPEEWNFPSITLLSPHCCDLDGGLEISAAGISFHFAHALNPKNVEMAPIGIVGAIGDVQEQQGFLELNDAMVQLAIKEGLVEVKRGLRCFGTETRALHKVLEYNSDPYVLGVTGSESGTIEFLQNIGIDPRKGNSWKTLSDLTQAEMENLLTGIILKRQQQGELHPEDILGYDYVLLGQEPGTPFRNAKEFATLLNACGRMDKSSLGLGACLGDPLMKQKALSHLSKYKKTIVHALNWFKEHKETKKVVEKEGYVIVNAGNDFISSIIGTMLSIVAKSGAYPEGTYLLGLAKASEEVTKVSIRMAGLRMPANIALHKVVQDIVNISGGEAGGHAAAAGAMIPAHTEQEFIDVAKKVLEEKIGMQNQIVMQNPSER